MKPSEAAMVVAKLAAVDNRTESEAAAHAWAEALDPRITLTDALDAVADHRRTSTDWCQPAHINRLVAARRRDRLAHAGPPPVPDGLTQAQERTWLRTWQAAVSDGQTQPAQIADHAVEARPELAATA